MRKVWWRAGGKAGVRQAGLTRKKKKKKTKKKKKKKTKKKKKKKKKKKNGPQGFVVKDYRTPANIQKNRHGRQTL